VGEQVPSRAWVEVVMRGAPVLAVPQAVAAASAGEGEAVPVEVAAVAAEVVAGDAGKDCLDQSVIFGISTWRKSKMRYINGNSENPLMNSCYRLTLVLAVAIGLGSPPRAFGAAAVKQKIFSSAEEGVQALIEAIRKNDTKDTLTILGPEAKSLIESGDQVADRKAGEGFVKAYEQANKLVKSGDNKAVLEVGKDEWPFPIPLVKENAGWRFDTQEGKEELLNRRIGRNELDVIQVCLAIVDAEREYYQRDPDGDKLLQYAQKLISTKGKRDGLYWETKPNEQPSPLGSLVAQARAEGYKGAGGKPVPYHGYYYKLLTGQGKDAPGGAYDYLVRGKMIGGFGVVAYPAQYGSSGIMTFIVNHDGVVYQKDLGPKTASIAQSMTKFNPDKTWTAVKQ
jgi:Protein of unknown function (DUF2950)